MLLGAAGVAHAGGDPARGETLYEDCVACHPIERVCTASGRPSTALSAARLPGWLIPLLAGAQA